MSYKLPQNEADPLHKYAVPVNMQSVRTPSPDAEPAARPCKRCTYPIEVRRQAVTLKSEGMGAKRIGKILGIDSSIVKGWLRRYREFGEESLQPYWHKSRLLHGQEDAEDTRSRKRRRPPNEYQKELKRATKKKYGKAVRLYSKTDMTVREICEQTGVSVSGFKRHIDSYHRELMLRRNDIHVSKREAGNIQLRGGGTGQTLMGHRKYKDAIAACSDERYIEYNVSEIARMFHLDGTSLGNQLRTHYPDVIPMRELERMRRGIGDNVHRGAKKWCVEQYADAIEMLRTTELTIRQVSDACDVSFSGLKSHLLHYHKDIVAFRASRRREARNSRRRDELNGNGAVNRPRRDKEEQYREAVEMYRTTLLPLSEISLRAGVPLNGLTYHIYRWHRDLVLERKGIGSNGMDEYADLKQTPHYLRSTREKYAGAIARLREGAESVAEVAASFGFNAETFRDYLSKHEPELAGRFGQRKLENGRNVWVRSSAKYDEAIRIYSTTTENLKSIASRLGLVYISLSGYVRRNMPEVIERHNALVAAERAGLKDNTGKR